jgi:hypothetical protein
MFKYVKFTKVQDEFTTHEFRGGDDEVKVNHFDVDVVSIESDNEDAIYEVITSQDERINCQEITKDEFKEIVKNSAQIERIRTIVKERITSKYSIADEIAMMKRDESDAKRVEYEAFVSESIAKGDELKSIVGY